MQKKLGTVDKASFKQALKLEYGFTEHLANSVTDTFFKVMYDGLKEGHNVRLNTVGTLRPTALNKRNGVNPTNLEKIEIDEGISIRFRTGEPLKREYKENHQQIIDKIRNKQNSSRSSR